MDQSFVIVVGIVVVFALAAFALRAVRAAAGSERPRERTPEEAMAEAMAKLSHRLDALKEPRPLRAQRSPVTSKASLRSANTSTFRHARAPSVDSARRCVVACWR